MGKLAVIHTTSATIEPLKALAADILPGENVINFLDDSILPELLAHHGDLSRVQERVMAYVRFAAAQSDAILEACSSIGELVELARRETRVPIVRIDEAMAEEAVARASRIAVAATLPTTLAPTTRLLEQKAALAGRQIEIVPVLIPEAYQRLATGDKEGHDQQVVQTLRQLSGSFEAVVLAQASMARVLTRLSPAQQRRCLTSPRSAMERVRECIRQYEEGLGGDRRQAG